MKTIPIIPQRLPRARRFSPRQTIQPIANRHLQHTRAQGVALIIVLAIIVLVATLVIGFLTLATSERRASTTVAQNAETRALAENAVDLVMGQIRAATTNLGNTKTWASQPGMIRVYGTQDDGQSDGLAALDHAYKLYSSGTMVVTSTADIAADELVSAGGGLNTTYSQWWTQKGLFVDINEPVAGSSGTMQYPIIDGGVLSASGVQVTAAGTKGFAPTNSPNANSALTYYVDSGTCSIQGFGVNPVAQQSEGGEVPPNPAAMPVRWLYQLKDGTLIAPQDENAGTGVVSFSGSDTQLIKNGDPIVGRIAFWTDDETCKINVNTASEGTSWDTPVVRNSTDYTNTNYSYTYSIPGGYEYQRYPGHPATVCLSAALGHWYPVGEAPFGSMPAGTATSYANQIKPYFSLAPRLQFGGSDGGSIGGGGNGAGGNYSTGANINYTINLDDDRLFASVDELYYSPQMTSNSRETNSTFATSTATNSMDSSAIDKLKFILTTSSRAPDVTLYNTPKMSVWPQYADTANLVGGGVTQALAFCSKIGHDSQGNTYEYYFSRANATSASTSSTADWNAQDKRGTLRNQTLFQYLQNLTGQPAPGFTGTANFVTKYTQGGRDQILTEIFDYIRSQVNITSSNDSNTSYTANSDYSSVPMAPNSLGLSTLGFGRTATITQASLVLYASPPSSTSGSNQEMIHGAFLFDPYIVSPGFECSPQNQIVVTVLKDFQINGTSLGFPTTMTSQKITANAIYFSGPCLRVPIQGPLTYMNNSNSAYPFLSNTATGPLVSNSATSMTFSGGILKIQIQDLQGQVYQTLYMNFPPSKTQGWPVPLMVPSTVSGGVSTPGRYTTFQNRIADTLFPTSDDPRNILILGDITTTATSGSGCDVVRSVELLGNGLLGGDVRMLAGLKTVPADYFNVYDDPNNPNSSYYSNTAYHVDSLKTTAFGPGPGDLYSNTLTSTITPEQFGTVKAMNLTNPAQTPAPGSGRPATSLVTGALALNVSNAVIPTSSYNNAWPQTMRGIPGTSTQISEASPSTPVAGGQYVAKEINPANTALLNGADWDNGQGVLPDGPYINLADQMPPTGTVENYWGTGQHYASQTVSGTAYFTPNRQIASAVQFGSLPSGIVPLSAAQASGISATTGSASSLPQQHPWQTLLFCPNPAGRTTAAGIYTMSRTTDPIGFQAPQDHLLLNLFTMPSVQPYVISEPLSTAGKVNMNYQILPFNNIERSTAIRGVLDGSRMIAILTTDASTYKYNTNYSNETRYDINSDVTLYGFQQRFNSGDIFHSASEICDIFLAPQQFPSPASYGSAPNPNGLPYTRMMGGAGGWWSQFGLTGDNSREEPYKHIYPLLTTKSNSYRVYVRVQALRQIPSDQNTGTWTEGKSQIVGEYRGSYLLERYIDPNDPNLPDFAGNIAANGLGTQPDSPSTSLDDYYRFRVLERKQFAP